MQLLHMVGQSRSDYRAAPSAGFEPALPAPEADALSPELRGHGAVTLAGRRVSKGNETFRLRLGASLNML